MEVGFGQDHIWLHLHRQDGQCWFYNMDEHNHILNMIVDHCRRSATAAPSIEGMLLGK